MSKNTNLESADYFRKIAAKVAEPLRASELYEKLSPNLGKIMEVYKSINPLPSYFDELSKATTSSAAMLAALESPNISEIKALAASMQLENHAIEAYRNMFGGIEQSALSKLHEQSAAAVAMSEALQSSEFQKLAESLSAQNSLDVQYPKAFSDAAAAASSISHLSKAFNYSPLFNDDFLKTQNVIRSLLEEVSLSEIEFTDFSDYAPKDNEIQAELAEAKDFKLLSIQTKKYIFAALILLFSLSKGLPRDLSISLLGSYIYESYIKANEKPEKITRKSELSCSPKDGNFAADLKAYRNYRLITAGKVNLREEPGMKSMVMLELPAFTLVRVLDKSHRSWLEVEVQVEDEILQGWVARRYTKYFR